jgi:protein involved in polysaccharide export with SLBB domain
VNESGSFPYFEDMTVENLVFLAGGFKESASKSSVEVARRLEGAAENESLSAQIFSFSINEELEISSNASDFKLKPFDLVIVRKSPYYEVQSIVEVEGEVRFPGKYALESKEERISDIIQRAGGLSNFAYPKAATLIRRTEYYENEGDGGDETAAVKRDQLETLLSRDTLLERGERNLKIKEPIGINLESIMEKPQSKQDLILKEGDILSIPRQLQTVRVRGEVLHPGTVIYDQVSRFNNIISKVGGFTEEAKIKKSYIIYANGSAERTKKFLWINNFPKIEPGAEIIIPKKKEKRKISPQEVLGLASSVLSVVLVIDRLTQ